MPVVGEDLASLLQEQGSLGLDGAKVLDCSPGSHHELGIFFQTQGAQVTHFFESSDAAKAFSSKNSTAEGTVSVGSWSSREIKPNEYDVIVWLGAVVFPNGAGAIRVDTAQDATTGYAKYCKSIRDMYEAIKPGGFLIIDCIESLSDLLLSPSGEEGGGTKKVVSLAGGGSGDTTQDWSVEWLADECVLRWSSESPSSVVGFTVAVGNTELSSALIQEGGGFSQLYRLPSSQEDAGLGMRAYAVRKGSDLGHYERQLRRYKRVWNSDGRMCWGLCPGIPPLLESYSTGSPTEFHGAMVHHNTDLFRWMVGKLPPTVGSILEVGCGMGRTLVNLTRHFGEGVRVAGCDPSKNCILSCQETASQNNVADRISLFTCTIQELEQKEQFEAVWSECALAHCTRTGRQEALDAMAAHMSVGGMLLLNDEHLGPIQASPKTQLHYFERMHMGADLWTLPEYIDGLQKAGFEVSEVVDLTPHVDPCYNLLSKECLTAASEAEAAGNEEDKQTYLSMSVDYLESGKSAVRGESLWSMFICKKAPWGSQT